MQRYCCFISEDQQPKAKAGEVVPGCQKDAEWEIRSGDGPDDFTDSCTEHVGEMLTEAPEHKIYPINET